MKAKLTLLLCLGLLSLAAAEAHDVYVYTTGNYTPVQTVKNLRSIVFRSQGLRINTKDGKTTEVPYADFDYFRFYATPVPTAIKSATADEASIHYDGTSIDVRVSGQVDRVEVISTSGKVLAQLKPGAGAFSVNATALPAGTLLVKVVVGDKTYVKKIIKK